MMKTMIRRDDENSTSIHGNTRSHNDQSRDINHNQYEPTDDDDGQNEMRYLNRSYQDEKNIQSDFSV